MSNGADGSAATSSWTAASTRIFVMISLDRDPLIDGDVAALEFAAVVRQRHFDVHLLFFAQAEMGDRRLRRGVAEPDGDLLIADQGRGVAELAGLVEPDLRT